jgi:hypothetical protein
MAKLTQAQRAFANYYAGGGSKGSRGGKGAYANAQRQQRQTSFVPF